MRVGFVGVGRMGGAMATATVRAGGHDVTVYDVSAEAVARLVDEGATAGATPAEVAARSEVVSIVVLDDAQVRHVVAGPDGIFTTAAPGTVVAVHSTIDEPTIHELAAQGKERGVDVVDAPVTGGHFAPLRRALTVMVGGPQPTYERLLPAMEPYAGLALRMGGLGTGMATKLARNLIGYVQGVACYEGMRLAEEAGVDLGSLARIIEFSNQQSSLVDAVLARPSVRPLAEGDDPAAWENARYIDVVGRKDLGAAIRFGAALGIDLPTARAAAEEVGPSFGLHLGPTTG